MSLTCVPCKLFEHIVCSNIMAHLDEYQLLSDRQHAFRKRYSCETQLTTVINDWVKILDNGGQVDTFIMDFEKAFDTPPPQRAVVNGASSFVRCPIRNRSWSIIVLSYINDTIDSEIRLFADDCVCYREIRDTDDSLKLQKDMRF